MSQTSSCVRCQQPLAVESASGLCDACSKALETSRPQGTDPVNDDRTRSQLAGPDAATLTAGFEVDATKGWSGPLRMRAAPAGYDLIRYLGGGGMGDVFLAREHFAERLVAIKFLRPTGNPATKDRFLKEVRALGRIEHPNVVRVISVELDRADPYYTMEYGAGGTLADRLKSEGPYEPNEAVRIAALLSDAVAATHKAGIFHRDIKPSNVILTVDGTPKLSDYGLAKLAEEQDGLTRTTQAIGTPAFMPPEQVSRKFGDIGPPTDVYGLGATLYAMLTGRAPFEGDSNEDIISKVRSDEPLRPCKLRPDLSMGLEAVVMKCLEKRPADRYASGVDLAWDLERDLAGEATVAQPLTRLRRAASWLRRKRVRIGGAIALVALIASAVGIGMALNPPAESIPSPADGEWIRNDLKRGAVTLIGATDLPRYHRFPLETVTLGLSPAGDKACYYHAFHHGLVELSPAPGLAEYRLEFEMQELKTDGAGGVFDYIGFYFGYATAEANGTTAHALFAATYQDHRPANNPKLLNAGLSSVLFRKMGWIQNPGGEPLEVSTKSDRYITFKPGNGLPGPWRKFRADISPDLVHVVWEADPGKPETLIHWPGDQVRQKFEEVRKSLAGKAPEAAAKLPPWTPDRPLGVIATQAAIAVKNVSISPLPLPPN